MRSFIAFSAIVLVSLAPVGSRAAENAAKDQKVLPPDSNAYGKSLQEWLKLYWEWAYGGQVGQGVGPVMFLPLPAAEETGGSWTVEDPTIYSGHLDVTVPPGTPFVLPLFAWIAERYEGYPEVPDDPFLPDDLVGDTIYATLLLDGKPILTNFEDFYVPPTPFDPIVEYAEPSAIGSVAAIGFQGVGFVCAPLAPGVHTITLDETYIVDEPDLPFLALKYENSWTITVAPKGKAKK